MIDLSPLPLAFMLPQSKLTPLMYQECKDAVIIAFKAI